MTPQDDDVEPGGRAAGDVALPGVEAHDRACPPARSRTSSSPSSLHLDRGVVRRPARTRTSRAVLDAPTAAPIGRVGAVHRSRDLRAETAAARRCTAADPASPAEAGRPAARRRDHRGRRHAGRRLRRPASADRARRPAGRRPTITYVRDGQARHHAPSARAGQAPAARRPERHDRSDASAHRRRLEPAAGRAAARHVRPGRRRRPRRSVRSAASSTGTFTALEHAPGEGPEPVRRAHRRPARPERPDQRGRREPDRRRGGRSSAPCRACSCCCSPR